MRARRWKRLGKCTHKTMTPLVANRACIVLSGCRTRTHAVAHSVAHSVAALSDCSSCSLCDLEASRALCRASRCARTASRHVTTRSQAHDGDVSDVLKFVFEDPFCVHSPHTIMAGWEMLGESHALWKSRAQKLTGSLVTIDIICMHAL